MTIQSQWKQCWKSIKLLMQFLGFKTYSLHIPMAPHEKENFQGKARWLIPGVYTHVIDKAFLNFKTSVHQEQRTATIRTNTSHVLPQNTSEAGITSLHTAGTLHTSTEIPFSILTILRKLKKLYNTNQFIPPIFNSFLQEIIISIYMHYFHAQTVFF